jgi:hypothetical protein
MSVNLRPLNLGEIFDRIAEIYRKNFVLFAGLSGLYSGAIMILTLLQLWATSALTGGSAALLKGALLGVYLLVEVSVMFVLAGVSMAASNRAVAWVILGEPATISGAYKSILPKTGRYVWLMIVLGFRIFVWIIPLVIIMSIGIAFAAIAERGTGGAGFGILGGLFAFVGILAAMIVAVWVALRYSLAVPACVVEDLKAGQAIKRSVELTKGARGRIFLLLLLTAVISMIFVSITQFPFLIAVFRNAGQPISIGMQAIQQVLNFVNNTLIGPIYTIGLALFYYDQRIRKEGFDIEWMMKAAGLTALPATEGEIAPPAVDEAGTAQG